ncbi:hypothetical protein Scep_025962 [Stephania cephalantha]|uniref:Uncharacterized protein n=1 Tax=Stephania cephalantha TaxID=152367 RepID=A0AAP0ERH0_9MAGN
MAERGDQRTSRSGGYRQLLDDDGPAEHDGGGVAGAWLVFGGWRPGAWLVAAAAPRASDGAADKDDAEAWISARASAAARSAAGQQQRSGDTADWRGTDGQRPSTSGDVAARAAARGRADQPRMKQRRLGIQQRDAGEGRRRRPASGGARRRLRAADNGGCDAVNGAVARCRPVGCAISTKSRRSDGVGALGSVSAEEALECLLKAPSRGRIGIMYLHPHLALF